MSGGTNLTQMQTPGVYVSEIDAFGNSIVGVPTAVPIFIGYTEFAADPVTGKALYDQPVAVSSLAEYEIYFGGAAPSRFAIAPVARGASQAPDFQAMDLESGASVLAGFSLTPAAVVSFSLYRQMQLFFANGGGDCYVVAVGSYWANQLPVDVADSSAWLPGAITAAELTAGIGVAAIQGPTMIVVPEACQLDQAGYAEVIQAMMTQAGTLQDRVAILDLPGCLAANSLTALQACQANLWQATAPAIAYASYAAAYAPALCATVVTPDALDYGDLASSAPDGNDLVNRLLTIQANQLYAAAPAQLAAIQAAIATAYPIALCANDATHSGDASAYPPPAAGESVAQRRATLTGLLADALPLFKQIAQLIAERLNVMAPSGAIAGVWSKNDQLSGVWNAPANIALAAVNAPLYDMTDTDQGGFNVPANGQAIDVIRAQLNRGSVVWGARTLDGNSQDYRYLQVRRTLIYIEQSIKLALQAYVFAANDATTWSTVTASVSSFLTGLWQSGGLLGAKPSEAYSVSCGLGSTMTAQDVLDGYMIVAVTLSLVHPAEFIELTFTQVMGS